MTEEALRDELGRFGLIDQVKIVRDKNIGFFEYQCCYEGAFFLFLFGRGAGSRRLWRR
ncbi:hypothetical protein B0H16DRAFT_152666 [Mycena metata]|uniref:RRM domain-containing protein n=1 Tax=Mycena metata TaxID=1033252 RepID=A0AAD7MX60_9AGAR|nr:hypothetical protein B0H16DRAFT_152666 [Mycena metata]